MLAIDKDLSTDAVDDKALTLVDNATFDLELILSPSLSCCIAKANNVVEDHFSGSLSYCSFHLFYEMGVPNNWNAHFSGVAQTLDN